MSRPLRFIGRWIVTVGAVAGIALGVTLPIGMVAGLLIGLGSAAIMHLILGSPAGRLTLEQIATALGDLGVAATDLRHAPLEPTGVALALATSTDGDALLLKVYGRDAWDGQFLASIWSSMWRRGERPTSDSVASNRSSMKRSSRCSLSEPECRSSPSWPPGWRISASPSWLAKLPDDRSDPSRRTKSTIKRCREIWRAAVKLHGLGIAHGQLDGDRIVVRADGTPALGDFGGARVAAPTA